MHAGAVLAALTAVPVLLQALDHAVATASAASGDFYSTLDHHTVHPGALGTDGQLVVIGLIAAAAVTLLWAAYRMHGGSRTSWWITLVLLALPAGQQVVDRALLGGRWHGALALPLPLLTAALLLLPATRRFVRG